MLRIITVFFDFDDSRQYHRLHNVLLYSIKKNVNDAEIISIELQEPEPIARVRSFVTNTLKLSEWVKELELCSIGDHVVFLDCDMLVVGELEDDFNSEFDVAYTKRSRSSLPLNGGAIYCQVNERSLAFFRRFLEINNRMYNNKEFHQEWRNKYAGMNQAAFGYMLEKENHLANIVALPCHTWNVCQEDMHDYNPDARVIHIKGRVRRSIFSDTKHDLGVIRPIVEMWKRYEYEYEQSIKHS
jgi:hypothetical protein